MSNHIGYIALMNGKATYNLDKVKDCIEKDKYRITITASNDAHAHALGFDDNDIVIAVLALDDSDFYKTMEAEKRPGFWQDVYHKQYRGLLIYLKLQFVHDVIIISFKEK